MVKKSTPKERLKKRCKLLTSQNFRDMIENRKILMRTRSMYQIKCHCGNIETDGSYSCLKCRQTLWIEWGSTKCRDLDLDIQLQLKLATNIRMIRPNGDSIEKYWQELSMPMIRKHPYMDAI